MAPTNQIHDFNPGIAESGLFWTIGVPDERVEVDLGDATASMSLSNAEVSDFFSIPNALMHGKSLPADASFRMHWQGVKSRVHLHDPVNHFDAMLIEDSATIQWSAREEDFLFVSDPEETSTTVFAAIGQERNGVFF